MKNTPKHSKKQDKKAEEHTGHAKHKVTKEDIKNNPGEGLKKGEEIDIPLQSDDVSLSKKDPKNAAGESIVHKEAMAEESGEEKRPENGKALNSEGPNIPTPIGEEPKESDVDKNKDVIDPEHQEFNKAGQSKTHEESMKGKHGHEKRSDKGFNKLTDENSPSSPGTDTGSMEERPREHFEKNAAGESKIKADIERKGEDPR